MSAKRDIEKIVRNLRRGIGFSVSKKAMRAVGLEAIDMIVKRTRRGSGVPRTNAKQRPLKPLTTKYKNFRRTQKLDPTTKPSKSNLTFSGQMLRSMVIKEVSNRTVTWGPSRRRRKGGLTNEQVGEFVSETRPFNNLSRSEITKLARAIDKDLDKLLRRV